MALQLIFEEKRLKTARSFVGNNSLFYEYKVL